MFTDSLIITYNNVNFKNNIIIASSLVTTTPLLTGVILGNTFNKPIIKTIITNSLNDVVKKNLK